MTATDKRVLNLDPRDNVATTIAPLEKGERVDVGRVDGNGNTDLELVDAIPAGHKFSLTSLNMGEAVFKYGVVIGHVAARIACGEHVHVHNIESARGRGDRA